MRYFKLDQFPGPEDYRAPDPLRERRLVKPSFARGGGNNGNFRLAYKYEPERKKARSVRFRLSGPWRLETLAVITEYLNSTDVEWLHIANEHGNNVWSDCFSSIGGFGEGRERS